MLKELLEISFTNLFIICFKVMLVVIACSFVVSVFSVTMMYLFKKLGYMDS